MPAFEHDPHSPKSFRPFLSGLVPDAPVDLAVPLVRPRVFLIDEITFANVPFFDGHTCRPLKMNLMVPRRQSGERFPCCCFSAAVPGGNGQRSVDSGTGLAGTPWLRGRCAEYRVTA
jgi:hypothetical protein